MIDGLSKGKIRGRYGHKRDYWETESNITSEFFAHFIEAQFDSEEGKFLKARSLKIIKSFLRVAKKRDAFADMFSYDPDMPRAVLFGPQKESTSMRLCWIKA